MGPDTETLLRSVIGVEVKLELPKVNPVNVGIAELAEIVMFANPLALVVDEHQ